MTMQAPLVKLLSVACAMASLACAACAMAAPSGHGQAMASQVHRLGDKVYGPATSATIAQLAIQSNYVEAALLLLDAKLDSDEVDPAFRQWKDAKAASWRTQFAEPGAIERKHARRFGRLKKPSSVSDRIDRLNDFRNDHNNFVLDSMKAVSDAIEAMPLAAADTVVQSVEQEVARARKTADDEDEVVRRKLDAITWRYVSQYGKNLTACWPGGAARLAAERDEIRWQLRDVRDAWPGYRAPRPVSSGAVATINYLLDDILSADKEETIVAQQTLTRGRYCLKEQLFDIGRQRGNILPLLLIPVPPGAPL